MKELDRIKQEVAIEFSAGNYESFEQAVKVYDAKRMINELCKRYGQLVGENALKEAAENGVFNLVNGANPKGLKAKVYSSASVSVSIDKSSITNPKNVKLI